MPIALSFYIDRGPAEAQALHRRDREAQGCAEGVLREEEGRRPSAEGNDLRNFGIRLELKRVSYYIAKAEENVPSDSVAVYLCHSTIRLRCPSVGSATGTRLSAWSASACSSRASRRGKRGTRSCERLSALSAPGSRPVPPLHR